MNLATLENTTGGAIVIGGITFAPATPEYVEKQFAWALDNLGVIITHIVTGNLVGADQVGGSLTQLESSEQINILANSKEDQKNSVGNHGLLNLTSDSNVVGISLQNNTHKANIQLVGAFYVIGLNCYYDGVNWIRLETGLSYRFSFDISGGGPLDRQDASGTTKGIISSWHPASPSIP